MSTSSTYELLTAIGTFLSGLGTVAIPVLAIYISQLYSAKESRSEVMFQRHVKIFDQVSITINELLCYMAFINDWNDFTPPEIIERKRILDRLMWANAPLHNKDTM